MPYTPHFPPTLRAEIALPSSKSLSNRALLLCALGGPGCSVERMSSCNDTYVMWRALTERPATVDIQAAGTAMRFLTAYFAVCSGERHVLTGTERMRQRPIGVLVEALRSLGAGIEYTERAGYPPLRVTGRRLTGGRLRLAADVSSQYISALLMVAPTMAEGLTIELAGEIASRPYIDMTLAMMRSFGATAGWKDGRTLRVEAGGYTDGLVYPIEGDWSAASYWYEMVALSRDAGACVRLPWLYRESLQGDSVVRKLFVPLGVRTAFDEGSGKAILTKDPPGEGGADAVWRLDLRDCPDLAQTLVVTCAMLRRPFRFTGLQSLRIKETDRMAAVAAELKKFGVKLGIEGDDALYVKEYAAGTPRYDGTPIATYDDHRMAMAFAPAAILFDEVTFEHPEVVEKSYPDFWEHIRRLSP